MKLTPVIISVILASSALGYGFASAQMAGPGGGTPCSASYPCAKICGDHPCAPGEVYTAGGQASANATAKATVKTNSTSAPAMKTQVNISANVTATKTASSMNGTNAAMHTLTNMTSTNSTTSMQTQTSISANATATKTGVSMNGTGSMNKTSTATVPPPAPMQSPEKQVSSGTAPADVKCPSGYQLVLNKFDSRPACVTPDVMAKLIARGWASSS